MPRTEGERTSTVLVWATGATEAAGEDVTLTEGLCRAGCTVRVLASAQACLSEALIIGRVVFVVQADTLNEQDSFWLEMMTHSGLGPVLGHGRVWTQLDDSGVRVLPERLLADEGDALVHYLSGALALHNRGIARPAPKWRGTEAPEEFVIDTIHEFRTPVAVVHSYAELLRDGIGGDLNPRQVDYVERILEGSRRAVQLFDDFVASYRLRLFEGAGDTERPQVSQVVEHCLTGFAPTAVESSCDSSIAERELDADGAELHRALRRVLEWAARFGAGAPGLDVVHVEEHVVFAVSFEGPIPSRHDIEVLEVGTMFDGVQRKSVTKVFGVGVELARTLLAGMGARIELVARDEGGVFRLHVPTVGAADERAAA